MSRERAIVDASLSVEAERLLPSPQSSPLSAVPSGTRPRAPSAAPTPHRGRILVIDDTGRAELLPTLARTGDAIVATALEALSWLAQGDRFELVLIDPVTQSLSGDTLYRDLLRTAPDQAPSIAFIAAGPPGERRMDLQGVPPASAASAASGVSAEVPDTRSPRAPETEDAPRPVGVVMVADDDPSQRKLMVEWLSRAGLTCEEQPGGQAAVDALLADPGRVDALVLDANMPGLDGFGVVARLRANPAAAAVPILMVTAGVIDELAVARGVSAGARDFLTKPSTGSLLVAKVRAASERTRAERELRARVKSAEARAVSDPVTCLLNRAAFDTRLREWTAITVRHRDPLALLLIDVDHFKEKNDLFGHVGGDRVLLHFAWAVRRSVRTSDQAFRYGGDEFVVLLPKCDAEGALQLALRLKMELKASPVSMFHGQTLHIRFSAGIASAEAKNDFNVDDLVARADAALYAAKRAGRDRVSVGE